jgi:hypothetical protein
MPGKLGHVLKYGGQFWSERHVLFEMTIIVDLMWKSMASIFICGKIIHELTLDNS